MVYASQYSKIKYQNYLREHEKDYGKIELVDLTTLFKIHEEETVIFTSTTSLLSGLHLRKLVNHPRWPVLGVTHDINSEEVYHDLILAMVGGVTSYDGFICTSNSGQNAIKRLSEVIGSHTQKPAQLQLPRIPLGIDFSAFQSSEIKRRSGHVHFLYFGRISSAFKADLSYLLHALVAKELKGKPIKLTIAGSVIPPDEISVDALKGLIRTLQLEHQVKIITNTTEREKQTLFYEADVLISPVDSLQETFGMVILEAMAMGLPVIASDWSGYRELIDHGSDGFLISTYLFSDQASYVSENQIFEDRWTWYREMSKSVALDQKQLIAAIRKFVENPALISKMGEIGREKVRQNYDWPIVLNKLMATLTTISCQAQHSIPVSDRCAYAYDRSEVFSHYATHVITGDQMVVSGEYDDLDIRITSTDSFSSECLFMILETCRFPTKIKDLATPGDEISRHLAYLLKQGLLTIKTP